MNLFHREQRRDLRYRINAPASLTIAEAPSIACMLYLLDISCGGALVGSTIVIPNDARVTIRARLPFEQKWFGRDEIEFILRGKVIRHLTGVGQIAIQFDDNYSISTVLPE